MADQVSKVVKTLGRGTLGESGALEPFSFCKLRNV